MRNPKSREAPTKPALETDLKPFLASAQGGGGGIEHTAPTSHTHGPTTGPGKEGRRRPCPNGRSLMWNTFCGQKARDLPTPELLGRSFQRPLQRAKRGFELTAATSQPSSTNRWTTQEGAGTAHPNNSSLRLNSFTSKRKGARDTPPPPSLEPRNHRA